MTAVALVNASTPGTKFHCRSGNIYVADAFGNVTAQLVDLLDLLNAGFTVSQGQEFIFGSGGQLFKPMGNLGVVLNAAGVNPAAIGSDYVLATFLLQPSSFDQINRGIGIAAQGSFGATVNTKRVKLYANPTNPVVGQVVSGGTVIADTNAVTTNGGGWSIAAEVYKYGSNQQLALHEQAQVGAAVAALLAPVALTMTESAAIPIAVTGNATTAATDIVFNALKLWAMN
jgi:hypothetical protein